MESTRNLALRSVSKKICLLGDFAVGKTSLVRRFVYDLFNDHRTRDVGVKVSRKMIIVPHDDGMVEMTMLLWDLTGNEAFERFHTTYMRGAAGALLVYDVYRMDSLFQLPYYAEQMRSVNPQVKFALAANKIDLDEAAWQNEQARDLAAQLDAPIYFTSANTGEGIDPLFRHLGRSLLSG